MLTETQKSQLIQSLDLQDMICSTTAYYLGRQTIQVSSWCNQLVGVWPLLPCGTQEYIKRIVTEAFRRDDAVRATGKQTQAKPLGADCDRAMWEHVRALWSA